MQTIINISNGTTRMPEWNMAEPVNFSLLENEHIAIVGNNASGKTMLVNIITGAHPLRLTQPEYDFAPNTSQYVSDNIRYISFEDAYGSNGEHYYLQQRWNMHDIDKETPTARDILDKAYALIGEYSEEHKVLQKRLYDAFAITPMLDKYIISLSSGELRKLHLVKNLLSKPRVLILDNPFIGLDAGTRDMLKELLAKLSEEFRIQIILVLAKVDDIPDFITHIVEVKDRRVLNKIPIKEYTELTSRRSDNDNITEKERETIEEEVAAIPFSQIQSAENSSKEVIKFNNVSIRYGSRTILQNLNWTVRSGERWALNGPNGAGKSTLLSLVCADNPQSYACDIQLFGKKRGTGESIWEIKKRIGYVSPEMHRAYKHNIPAIRIVASGMKDSVGLYAKPTDEEYKKCEIWLRIFGIDNLANRNFLSLSSGEQRIVLLARAFVKDPQLLILDEPFHGLDNRNRNKVRCIINAFAKRKDKAIIMVSHYKEEYPTCINKEIELKRNQ